MKERKRIGRENTKKQMAHTCKIERKEKYENKIQIKEENGKHVERLEGQIR
jgi:hypothetical protein